ncbi:M57 family metalloprotease [Solitalea lacus]|uniref:M57 family metalloprotease n=1 Tax=Solitalea lacus TaxID=2911172 RepID=UPI001EDADE5E|nr:M57 family metalloprotease [Solitalea lacus]UKJ08728.1 M57 family metalloprotease [Solitalea lacus]
MKKTKLVIKPVKFLILSISLLSTMCCKKNIDTEVQNEGNRQIVKLSSDQINELKRLGFADSNVFDYGNYYLVEGDVLVSKKELESNISRFKQLTIVEQHKSPASITNSTQHNFTLYVDETIWGNYTWNAGLLSAVETWNSFYNSDVKLHLSYDSPQSANIIVKTDRNLSASEKLASNVAAVGAVPMGSTVGTIIIANDDFKPGGGSSLLSVSQATWNMIHEIGHTLGLQHTNWITVDGTVNPNNFILIPGTPNNNDGSSVMNGGTASYSCPNATCFSNYDQIAINYLFPLVPNSTLNALINGQSQIARSSQWTYTCSYRSVETGINYYWEVIGINGTNFYQNDYDPYPGAEISLPMGNYKIRCTISGGKYPTKVAEKTIVVN